MPPAVTPAEPRARFAAAAVDLVPPLVLVMALYATALLDVTAVVAGLACIWAVTRDALFGGRSPGKRLFGIQVVDDRTHLAPTTAQALLRNALFGVPFVNLAYAVVEGVTCVLRPDDSRFGDLWAGTSVFESTEDLRRFVDKHREPSRMPVALQALLGRMQAQPEPAPPAAEPEAEANGSASAEGDIDRELAEADTTPGEDDPVNRRPVETAS